MPEETRGSDMSGGYPDDLQWINSPICLLISTCEFDHRKPAEEQRGSRRILTAGDEGDKTVGMV